MLGLFIGHKPQIQLCEWLEESRNNIAHAYICVLDVDLSVPGLQGVGRVNQEKRCALCLLYILQILV